MPPYAGNNKTVIRVIVLCVVLLVFVYFAKTMMRQQESSSSGASSRKSSDEEHQVTPQRRQNDRVSFSSAPRCAEDGTESNGGCSGNGNCFIGKCFCNSGFTGEFCENQSGSPTGGKKNCPSSISMQSIAAELASNPNYVVKYDYCRHYVDSQGTAVVSRDRWQFAQKFEAGVWAGEAHGGDRDDQHAAWFGNYQALPNDLGNMIEIGSGPFTQTRTIINYKKRQSTDVNVNHITLVEPLMAFYIKNTAKCTYKDGSLLGYPTMLIKAGGEQARLKDQFDTVTMMNVLEHVLNAYHVLQNLHNLVKPGGILVFSERWYDQKWNKYEQQGGASAQAFWDQGHPINVKKAVFEHMLKHYEPLYRKDFNYEGDYPTDEGTYFIGRKKF